MNFNLNTKTLIITPNKTKNKILLDLTKNNQLYDVKFMNINEFKDNYLGTYKNDALYFLLKNFNIAFDVAKEYLENIFYNYEPLKEIYNDLKANDYLIFNDSFKKIIKNYHILVINYSNIDKYLKDILVSLNAEFIEEPINNYLPSVYEFKTIDDEINFVLSHILENLKNNNLNNIYLVNLSESYDFPLKRIAGLYNIPINFAKNKSILGTKTAQDFLNNLSLTRNIDDSINTLKPNDITNAIIDILNKYTIPDEIDDSFISIIKSEISLSKIKPQIYDNALNIININDMDSIESTYYLLNFNESFVPKNYFDDALIKDETRVKLGLNTSFDNLMAEKENIKKIISNYPNLIITYKLKDYFTEYLPSPLISDLNLPVIKNTPYNYSYSKKHDELLLAEKLDNYYKFNESNNILSDLYATIPKTIYKTYDNSFKGIDYNNLKEFLKGKTNLSYSSLDNYYKCAFRFYISNILKLDPFNDTFMTFIGKLFHDSLSHMYDKDFDLKITYQEYLKKRDLNGKEKFFVNKLYKELESIIEIIKMQDSHSKFTSVMTEKHISIDKSHDLTVNFLGFVDKIKYEEKDNTMLIAIIDYKTGTPIITLDNINYGLHLQLPIYIYLATNGLHRNVKIAGFYLQKILNPKVFQSDSPEMDLKNKLRLDGYTINEEEIINDLDDTNISSDLIKGLSRTNSGDFKKTAKLISQEEITKINNLINDLINKVVLNIEAGAFPINPKRIGDKLLGCENCNFKDICFKKEEDIVNLENTPRSAILGGEDNANMDE